MELDLESGFFQECTTRCPVEIKLQAALEPSAETVWIRTCPTKLGYQSKRSRNFSAVLNRNPLH